MRYSSSIIQGPLSLNILSNFSIYIMTMKIRHLANTLLHVLTTF